jgi:hypothetical protein
VGTQDKIATLTRRVLREFEDALVANNWGNNFHHGSWGYLSIFNVEVTLRWWWFDYALVVLGMVLVRLESPALTLPSQRCCNSIDTWNVPSILSLNLFNTLLGYDGVSFDWHWYYPFRLFQDLILTKRSSSFLHTVVFRDSRFSLTCGIQVYAWMKCDLTTTVFAWSSLLVEDVSKTAPEASYKNDEVSGTFSYKSVANCHRDRNGNR